MKKKPGAENRKFKTTSHTKGFYRFSRAYPGKTDENGYRDNGSSKQAPLSDRGRLAVYFAAILCFALAFIVTGAALKLSNREPPARTPIVIVTEETEYPQEDETEDETGVRNEE